MLLKKYHVVVFKDNEGVYKKLYVRGWMVFALIGLVVSLVAGNIHFWSYFADYKLVRNRLAESSKTVEEQKGQLISLASKLKTLEKDLTRVRDFDTKLRVMMNLDTQIEASSSMGGEKASSFSESYLPIHRQELLARKMHNFLHQLNTDVRLEEMRQQNLLHSFQGNRELLATTPSVWPTDGWVTSPFGKRISPFTGQVDMHTGIDISGKVGTPIIAPAQGVVKFAGEDGTYGKTVVVTHGMGLTTRYAHMDKISVQEGDKLSRGDLIGELGNTGRSTGPHLHYEVRLNGVSVDPMRYILN